MQVEFVFIEEADQLTGDERKQFAEKVRGIIKFLLVYLNFFL